MECFEEWWTKNHDEWSYDVGATAKAAWEAALIANKEPVATVPCSGVLCLLDKEIALWESMKEMEASPLGGNVVKEAHFTGTIAGLRMAINIILESEKA